MIKKILICIVINICLFTASQSGLCDPTPEQCKISSLESGEALKGSARVINLDSKKVEYFQETDQFVATGDVKIHIEQNDVLMETERVIYDKTKDKIIADGKIKIFKNGQVIDGSYAVFDLNEESGIIGNPDSVLNQINIKAETAIVYPESTDLMKGKATLNDEEMVLFLSAGAFSSKDFGLKKVDSLQSKKVSDRNINYKIKSREIIVEDDSYRQIITLKNADILIGKVRVASIPSLMMTTDKESKRIETTFPEIGHRYELGSYVGYGPVFNLPKGATLKLAPLVVWGEGNSGSVQIGGFGRFMNSKNKTEIMYSPLKDNIVGNGEHYFTENLKLSYGANDYVDNGFFGLQRPKYLAELVDYRKLGSAFNYDFYLRSSAGFAEQNFNNYSTGRFQLQGNLFRTSPIYTLGEWGEVGLSSDFSILAYGTGDTYGVLRAGPTFTANIGPLNIWSAYYQGSIYGDTPLDFDRYRYGKSNVMLRTQYKVTSYLAVGFFTSLNLTKDNYEEELVTENQFFAMIGPDDLKLKVGVDIERRRTMFGFDMMLGSEAAAVEFDKLKIVQ